MRVFVGRRRYGAPLLLIVALLIGLAPPASPAAEGEAVPFLGRPVAAVIDEFRAAGQPFVYSTNLIRDDLRVTVEPHGSDPVLIVRQILAAHGLTLRAEAGLYVVIRDAENTIDSGTILVVVRTRASDRPVADAGVRIRPDVPEASRVLPGIHEYQGVRPGRYRVDVSAEGFKSVSRMIEVAPGETTVVSVGMDDARPEIETIAVSASRYEILSSVATSRFVIDQRTIQNMPDVGEDPLRVAQRLPGAAAGGVSARAHFRGGELDEVGIVLNGQRLFDPFHIRDYQSIFSAIDARAIEGVEVYTGGFPVRFGDRMSGLVVMESLESARPRHTEIGVSVFNSSVLTTGSQDRSRWLLSARRGNLDLIIDPKFGRPKYYDVFGEFNYAITPDATLSVNALYADDAVQVVLESLPEELEQVTSKTRNAQLWIQLDNRWSPSLSSKTALSLIEFSNTRDGSLGDPEKIVGGVFDERMADRFGLRQDWAWTASPAHYVQWGLHMVFAKAHYDYSGSAEYGGIQALYRDRPIAFSRVLTASPEGGNYAAYISDRWKLSADTVVEMGLRWDDQTYTNLPSDSQLSPRFSLLHGLGPKTELRLSWGRYHQSQGINELQIEDGITEFWPAQRADHLIAGIRHLLRDQFALRVELFYKNMRRVRPRFENLYDPLGLIPELQQDRVRIAPESALSRGVEVSIDRMGGAFDWWASYTLSRATDRITGRDVPRSWDQRHALQGGIAWRNKKWDVALAMSVHSGWPTTDLALIEPPAAANGDPAFAAVPGPRNALRHGTFSALDFRVSRRFDLKKGSLLAFIEISNLLNRRNECCLDWDVEEDEDGSLMLELSRDYWMPRLPAIGVLWEF